MATSSPTASSVAAPLSSSSALASVPVPLEPFSVPPPLEPEPLFGNSEPLPPPQAAAAVTTISNIIRRHSCFVMLPPIGAHVSAVGGLEGYESIRSCGHASQSP